uniref:Uncharacterized protein n=1 Tax=Glossina austeni TaxID=7395 RepID=A0A1A9UU35_GLOAU
MAIKCLQVHTIYERATGVVGVGHVVKAAKLIKIIVVVEIVEVVKLLEVFDVIEVVEVVKIAVVIQIVGVVGVVGIVQVLGVLEIVKAVEVVEIVNVVEIIGIVQVVKVLEVIGVGMVIGIVQAVKITRIIIFLGEMMGVQESDSNLCSYVDKLQIGGNSYSEYVLQINMKEKRKEEKRRATGVMFLQTNYNKADIPSRLANNSSVQMEARERENSFAFTKHVCRTRTIIDVENTWSRIVEGYGQYLPCNDKSAMRGIYPANTR